MDLETCKRGLYRAGTLQKTFLLPQNWLDIVKNQKIDVILPVPLYVSPSLAENYCDRHIAKDWDMLMEYVYRNNNSEYENESFLKGICIHLVI